MPNYLRAREGTTWFFTVVTHQRQPLLCLERTRIDLREIIEAIRSLHPFEVEAWVLIPDHLHSIWTLPQGDSNYSTRWGLIKSQFSKRTRETFHREALLTDSRKRRRESTIWQRRFWEHQIRDEKDFKAHCDYIHYNPVKHGLVTAPRDWPYSTFHKFVKEGTYSEDWGSSRISFPKEIGGE